MGTAEPEERPCQGGSDGPPSPGRDGERDFHGDTRTDDTHASTTDPEAKLYRKARGSADKTLVHGPRAHREPTWSCGAGHATAATGRVEREPALAMIDGKIPAQSGVPGADEVYDTSDFVVAMRQKCVTPHVAQKIKGSAIDGRTTGMRAMP